MSIYPHKVKGVPTGRFRVEVVREGVRQVKYADTRKAAREIERQLAAGVAPKPKAPPPAEKLYSVDDLWLDCRDLWAGLRDHAQSRRRLQLMIEPLRQALGETPLRDIKLVHLDRVVSILMSDQGMKANTVNHYLASLSKALQWAEDRELINRRPKMPMQTLPTPETFTLSHDDEARMREALVANRGSAWAYAYVLLMDVQLASGCRISELLGMTTDKVLKVTREDETWWDLDLGVTKNGKERHVPLRDDLGSRFKALVEAGQLPRYPSVRRAFAAARRAAGLPSTQPTHAHRHTTASRLTALGSPTAEVMAFLGHSSVATTLRYISTNTDQLRKTARLLDGPRP